MSRRVAYTVGRFQPPTIGHRMLINATIAAAGEGGKAYVFVSRTVNAKDSPLPPALKVRLLEKMFQREVAEGKVEFINTDLCTPACGGPGYAFGYLQTEKEYSPDQIVFVIGLERLANPNGPGYFGPEAALWGADSNPRPKGPIPVGESAVRDMSKPANDAANMSGTKARGYVCDGKKDDFYTALGFTPGAVVDEVEDAYKIILDVICKRGTKRPRKEEEPTQEPPRKSARLRGGTEEPDPIPGGPDGEPVGGRRRRKTRRNKASSKALYRRGSRSRNGSSKTNRSSYVSRGYSKGSNTW